jgi:hypothetical protein
LDDPTLVSLLTLFLSLCGGAISIAYHYHRSKVTAEIANSALRAQVSSLSKQCAGLDSKVTELEGKVHRLVTEMASMSSGFYGFVKGRNQGLLEATRREIRRE